MNQKIIREKTVCFTGHRSEKLPKGEALGNLRIRLADEIEKAIQDGYNTFLFGGAYGWDLMAAEEVIKKKTVIDLQKPQRIRLIAVIPFEEQAVLYSLADHERYYEIISSNQSLAVTQPQNAVSYFPEFGYETYWRLLERMGSGRFEFQKNNYSTYKNRTHFSPIWMPDGSYTVNTWLVDAWTPVGMLSANLTDSLTIRGNLWSDWHIAPLKP